MVAVPRNWSTNLAGRDEASGDRYRKPFLLRLNEAEARNFSLLFMLTFSFKGFVGCRRRPRERGAGSEERKCVLMKHGWELGTRTAHKLSALPAASTVMTLETYARVLFIKPFHAVRWKSDFNVSVEYVAGTVAPLDYPPTTGEENCLITSAKGGRGTKVTK
jgi:hypothetical protein